MCKLTEFEILILEKPEISCEDFDALLGDFIENELSETILTKVQKHLKGCEECQDGLELYQQVIDIAGVIGRSPEPEPMPSDVRRRLHQRLNDSLGLKLSTAL